MINSKLIDLFSNLTKQESKLLDKLIYSPAFNQHKDVTALYEYLISLPRFKEDNLDPKIVFKHIFPKEKYNDLRLRHVISYLLKIGEDCLVQNDLAKQEMEYRRILLKAYRQHGLYRHFKNDLLLLKKTSKAQIKSSKDNLLSIARINSEAYEASQLIAENGQEFLLEADSSHDLFFISSKLKIACEKLLHKLVLEDDLLLQSIVQKIEQQKLTKNPLIDCYYSAYRAYSNPINSLFFRNFKEKIGVHSPFLEKEEIKSLLALAIQFCQERLKENLQEFDSELFEIYLHGLATEALLINQKLSYNHQKNIVDLGLKLQEITWVEDFISETYQLTEKSLQKELYRLNNIKVKIARKQYLTALEQFDEEEFRHPALIQDALKIRLNLLELLGKRAEYKSSSKALRIIQRKLKDKSLIA